MARDREYLEQTIAAVRAQRDRYLGWAKAANHLADEVERLWAREEETRRALRDLKRYAIYHGLLVGECVGWNLLKEAYGVDESWNELDQERG